MRGASGTRQRYCELIAIRLLHDNRQPLRSYDCDLLCQRSLSHLGLPPTPDPRPPRRTIGADSGDNNGSQNSTQEALQRTNRGHRAFVASRDGFDLQTTFRLKTFPQKPRRNGAKIIPSVELKHDGALV